MYIVWYCNRSESVALRGAERLRGEHRDPVSAWSSHQWTDWLRRKHCATSGRTIRTLLGSMSVCLSIRLSICLTSVVLIIIITHTGVAIGGHCMGACASTRRLRITTIQCPTLSWSSPEQCQKCHFLVKNWKDPFPVSRGHPSLLSIHRVPPSTCRSWQRRCSKGSTVSRCMTLTGFVLSVSQTTDGLSRSVAFLIAQG